jgi:anti-anti-sigma regulatory factor
MQTNGATVIRMDGVFDVPAAQRLARALAQTDANEQVRIDLTHVREFHDYGVTVLAQALASRGARIVVRGLRQHHLRLLKYFGIETGPSNAAEAELV